MFTVSRYPHGCFSWVDLSTHDADAAAEFFGGLLGWEKQALDTGYGMKYYTMHKDGHDVAGIAELPAGMEDFPASWNSYVKVDDLEALLGPIEAAGGTVVQPPFAVPDGSLIALIHDPDGAALGLLQPNEFVGAELVNTPGALCWNDVYTRDPAQTRAFYEQIFGWEFLDDGQGYHFIQQSRAQQWRHVADGCRYAAVLPPLVDGVFLSGGYRCRRAARGRVGRAAGFPAAPGGSGALLRLSRPAGRFLLAVSAERAGAVGGVRDRG